ncbi:STAS domain-containing protein [Mycobacterium hubeiense]|uniref:STAS domain-containing protein n=1 Tax=Mycobacterium hubeiense TaxID=1867256 RepID=UPI000C7ECBBB|nr:STAS domain-containing protein [Mycobacterium sp. QGD 101]
MYGNPTFDCDGARLRAQCRQLATVVTVTGDIDDDNVDRVEAYARRFVLPEKPVILDLSGVNSLSGHGVSLFYAVDEECFDRGVEWSLIPSPQVRELLRACGALDDFPIAGSVPEALYHFEEGIVARRRLLPLLIKKTA